MTTKASTDSPVLAASPGEGIEPETRNGLERVLTRTSYNPRYPNWLRGRPLLILTSVFGSLGDALFGYDQGVPSRSVVMTLLMLNGIRDYGRFARQSCMDPNIFQ